MRGDVTVRIVADAYRARAAFLRSGARFALLNRHLVDGARPTKARRRVLSGSVGDCRNRPVHPGAVFRMPNERAR